MAQILGQPCEFQVSERLQTEREDRFYALLRRRLRFGAAPPGGRRRLSLGRPPQLHHCTDVLVNTRRGPLWSYVHPLAVHNIPRAVRIATSRRTWVRAALFLKDCSRAVQHMVQHSHSKWLRTLRFRLFNSAAPLEAPGGVSFLGCAVLKPKGAQGILL
jgi:hypothetical protein